MEMYEKPVMEIVNVESDEYIITTSCTNAEYWGEEDEF